jgi:hypothetical protein
MGQLESLRKLGIAQSARLIKRKEKKKKSLFLLLSIALDVSSNVNSNKFWGIKSCI